MKKRKITKWRDHFFSSFFLVFFLEGPTFFFVGRVQICIFFIQNQNLVGGSKKISSFFLNYFFLEGRVQFFVSQIFFLRGSSIFCLGFNRPNNIEHTKTFSVAEHFVIFYRHKWKMYFLSSQDFFNNFFRHNIFF